MEGERTHKKLNTSSSLMYAQASSILARCIDTVQGDSSSSIPIDLFIIIRKQQNQITILEREKRKYTQIQFQLNSQVDKYLRSLEIIIAQFEQMDLTEKQLLIWKELGSELSAPPDLCQQALAFYTYYKQQELWPIEKASLVFRVAYFLSEKSQTLYDSEGRRLRGVALSANSILRDQPRHQQFLYHLKQMMRNVPLPPGSDHLEEEVGLFSRSLSFSLAFFNKLKSTLKRIKISQKSEITPDYQQQIGRFLWLLFIDSKAERDIGTDIIQSTCLMSCVFVFFLKQKYQQEGIFSVYFEQDDEGSTLSNEQEQLSMFMQSYFHIKDNMSYNKIVSFYRKYIDAISRNIEARRPFSVSCIQKNIYVLQKLYIKKLKEDMLDQSTFVRVTNTISNIPIRMTPFGRKPLMAPRNIPALSHRILSYDINEQQNQSSLSNRSKQEKSCFNILGKLKHQPTPKNNLIRATPMSQAMEMYNWLYEKKKKQIVKSSDSTLIQQMMILCSKSEGQQITEVNSSTIELIAALWQELKMHNDIEPVPPIALLLLSTHLTAHILNSPIKQMNATLFQEIGVSQLQVWQGLDLLLNFDKNMPLGLKLHLLAVQTSFISQKLWRNVQLVQVISEELDNSQHRLFKRILHQSAFEIHFLCRRLNLEEIIQNISYLIFQEALRSPQNLLFDRALQQLLLCSIYAGSRVGGLNTKFNEILGVCKEVLGLSAANYEQMIDKVRVGEKRDNIIVFYNMEFVPALKSYLKLLKSGGVSQLGQIPRVRQMISKQSANLARANHLASPQMATYFAYNQSPILRPKLKEINSNTVRRQQQYSMQDIQAKFGKFGPNTLRDTRKVKH